MSRILIIPACGFLKNPDSRTNILDHETKERCCVGMVEHLRARFDVIILCGGIFEHATVQTLPAAQVMHNYITKKYDVDSTKILLETMSRDTYENVLFSTTLLEANDYTLENCMSISIATNVFHGVRFKIIFKEFGFKNIQLITTPQNHTFKQAVRECGAILYTMYDKKGRGAYARHIRQKRTV